MSDLPKWSRRTRDQKAEGYLRAARLALQRTLDYTDDPETVFELTDLMTQVSTLLDG